MTAPDRPTREQVDAAVIAQAWHDVTCPEGPDCRDRLLHAASEPIAYAGVAAAFLARHAALVGLWQRAASAAAVCMDPAHDPQRPDGGQGPEAGHTFEITWRSRGSSAVVGGPHSDSDYWGEPVTQQVRAWSLREAFARVSTIPLNVWFPDEDDDVPAAAARPTERER